MKRSSRRRFVVLQSVLGCFIAAMGMILSGSTIGCAPMGGGGGGGTGNDNVPANVNDNGGGAVEPIFPANYREIYVEARDCRSTFEHADLVVESGNRLVESIRVWASPESLDAYNAEETIPLGGVLIKEEFHGPDCTDDSELLQFRVMRKEAAGFAPDSGDWNWQRVLPDRTVVVNEPIPACISCHSTNDFCVGRDFVCTDP